MRQPSQHFDAHLKIKVFLDDGQRDVIIGCEARKVAETETSEQGVDFGPQVFWNVHDGQGRGVGRLWNHSVLTLQRSLKTTIWVREQRSERDLRRERTERRSTEG